MTTNFNLSTVSQSTIFFQGLNINFYEKLIDFSENHPHAARLLGLPAAFGTALLMLASIVSTVVEILIKSVANIFGSPFSEECRFSKGVKQIFVNLPLFLIQETLFFSIELAVNILITPFTVCVKPAAVFEQKQEVLEDLRKALTDAAENPSDTEDNILIHTYT